MQKVKCIIRSFVLVPSAIIIGAFLQWKLCVCLWVMCKWLVLSRSFFPLPSASSILGMSRNFSATSKAVFRLPMGSSYRETPFTVGLHWVCHKTIERGIITARLVGHNEKTSRLCQANTWFNHFCFLPLFLIKNMSKSSDGRCTL